LRAALVALICFFIALACAGRAQALCEGREATLIGTAGADRLVGTPARDVIDGLGGNDVIRGLDGSDVICGGGGADRVRGGEGRDDIKGNDGQDLLEGGGGNDLFVAGGGRDVIHAGGGNDGVFGRDRGDDVYYLEQGSDYSEDTLGKEAVFGGPGLDSFALGFFNDTKPDYFDGGQGADTVLYGAGGPAVINLATGHVSTRFGSETVHDVENAEGSIGNDTLIGNGVRNFLIGDGGDDHIEGRGGSDRLLGDIGIDFLDGGVGNDECLNGETVMNCEA
jgi:Ca2+-binding RTX toxin-like protein